MNNEPTQTLEEAVTDLAERIIYPLWGKNHTAKVRAELEYQIRFDKKLRDLTILYAKGLTAGEPRESLTKVVARMYNRVCSLAILNKQSVPDNRICASCFEEKTRGEFMNFDPNPKHTNVCEDCQRKYAEAIQSVIGLPN